jgi:hypothetical protein
MLVVTHGIDEETYFWHWRVLEFSNQRGRDKSLRDSCFLDDFIGVDFWAGVGVLGAVTRYCERDSWFLDDFIGADSWSSIGRFNARARARFCESESWGARSFEAGCIHHGRVSLGLNPREQFNFERHCEIGRKEGMGEWMGEWMREVGE